MFYLDGLQLLDDVLQFLRERAIKDLAFALPYEFKPATVQEEPVQPERFLCLAVEREIAVAGVAQERVADACEVGADLVHASGLELDFHEVVAFVVLFDAVVRDGLLRVLAGFADLHLGSLGRVGAGETLVDGAFFLFQVALDERKVELFHFVFANHASEVAERVPVECCNEHAGRFLVQAVCDGGLEVEAFAFTPFPEVFHEAFARAGAAAGLARESRGLVHDDIVFGLDDDIEFACAPSCLLFGRRGVLAPGRLALRKPRFRRTPLVS